jgi:hypothetical protein
MQNDQLCSGGLGVDSSSSPSSSMVTGTAMGVAAAVE